jgi:tetratricopeptide (TPR) repeat protein
MWSEIPQLREALESLDAEDRQVQAALAAIRANRLAAQGRWADAAKEYDRLKELSSDGPLGWLRTPGLIRVATALVHEGRQAQAATLLTGGAIRRIQDGLPLVMEFVLGLAESEELWRPLLAAIEAGLAKNPHAAALLELRAELSGQWCGFADQVRDYTAAIDALTSQPKEKVEADLQRLYCRRGDVHFRLKQWQAAVDDYARGGSELTRDPDLLSRRAQAYEKVRNWPAASTDWTRALEANTDAGRLHAEFARRLLNANQSELAASHRRQAQTYLETSLARKPKNAVLAMELADVLLMEDTRGWTVLKPTEMKSVGGATLTLLEDGSILSSGKRPDGDDYIIKAPPGVNNIRAIALDVLPHGTINGGSVGRGQTGEFLLGRIEVSRLDRSGGRHAVALTKTVADSEAVGEFRRIAARAVIDGKNGDEGWTAIPLFEPHRLVVKPGQPIIAGATTLQVVLRQDPKRQGMLIGRFRLWVSDDPAAFEREQKRCSAMQLTDPWSKLGAAYALHGRQDVTLP